MAIDNTPPRLKLIVTIAVITVITLVAIDFVTKSYFAMMTDEAKHEKIAPTHDRDEQVLAEQKAFGAGMPIDQAMAQIAKGTRGDAITPQASDDVGAVTGWAKLPHPAPTVQHAVAGGTDVPMIGDGGVMLYSDGGAMLGPDGGVMLSTSPVGDAGAGDAGANKADGGAGRHGRRAPGGAEH